MDITVGKVYVRVASQWPMGIVALAHAEDGQELAWCFRANEDDAKKHMGVVGTGNHELYRVKYPGGFEVVWEEQE